MLQTSTLKFLKALKQNNNKTWFDDNKSHYEAAKADVVQFCEAMLGGLAKMDPRFAQLGAKDCTYRIHRDVRFSKEKTPYKTNLGVYFSPGGKKSSLPGYYVHIEPGKGFLAVGLWQPQPDLLAKVRQEIDYNWGELLNIIRAQPFVKLFPAGFSETDKLQRPPKGYDEPHPAMDMLKLKSFLFVKEVSDAEMVENTFSKKLLQAFETAYPFNKFLEEAFH